MKFFKKYKFTIIFVFIALLIFLVVFELKEILVPDDGIASYGNRLVEENKYPIDDSIYSKIDSDYKANKNVTKIEHKLQGKVINYYITVTDSVAVSDAQSLGNKIVTYFTEEQLKYYSIQVYVIKTNEKLNNFPIIGMKDPLSKSMVWTKDREIVDIDDEDEKDEN